MRKRISIAMVLLLGLVVPIVAMAAALLWLSVSTNRAIAEDLGDTIVRRTTIAVQDETELYIAPAKRISNRYVRMILGKTADPNDLASWHTLMLDHIVTTPNIASICFTNLAGETTWLLRSGSGLEYGLRDADAKGGLARNYRISNQEVPESEPFRVYPYKPEDRTWFKVAQEHDTPVWTPIYPWFTLGDRPGSHDSSIGYTRRVFDRSGTCIGVLVIDVSLESLNELLREQSSDKGGALFIIDADNQLVAASEGPVSGDDAGRLTLPESTSPIARTIGLALLEHDTRFTGDLGRFVVNGVATRVRVESLLDEEPGIDWRIVLATPEPTFLARSNALSEKLVLGGTMVAGVGIVLVVLIGSWLVSTFRRIGTFVGEVGSGKFDHRLDLQTSRELCELSDSLNRMAADLEQQVRLRVAKEAAEAAYRTKSAFIASVSHELRTPLNAIIGYADLLRDQARAANQDDLAEDLNQVLKSSYHLLALINDLLDLAKLEAGRLAVEVEDVAPGPLIDEAIDTARPLALKQGNQLIASVDPDVGCVRADPLRLRQVLLNLLGNAAKFTVDGRIELRVRRDAQRVRFEVIDSGIGIDSAAIERIFEPFAQADEGIARQFGGTGLGLSLSQQLARQMGGSITATSTPGRGSTFVLTLDASLS